MNRGFFSQIQSYTWILCLLLLAHSLSAYAAPPKPIDGNGQEVDWWFALKLGASKFPGCSTVAQKPVCTFGGRNQPYKSLGLSYVVASSSSPEVAAGDSCIGSDKNDPLGATFDDIYNKKRFFVIWNDQFYGEPKIQSCSGGKGNCNSPWGHSKGMVAWDKSGEGVVIQVSTPSWPGAGSSSPPKRPEKVGNTLGCISTNNNTLAAQHFFALRLSKDDLLMVLDALKNASAATDLADPQIVRNGGPSDVQERVNSLGKRSTSIEPMVFDLSTNVKLISKPSRLHVPPWQMVSALLEGTPGLRTATWWATPYIPTTAARRKPECWDASLPLPGRVEVALTGSWDGTEFSLRGTPYGNHAKLGVSLDSGSDLAIFGDLNQQGALNGKCDRSQNGRGGLFFVVKSKTLRDGVASIIAGETASNVLKPVN